MDFMVKIKVIWKVLEIYGRSYKLNALNIMLIGQKILKNVIGKELI